MHSVDPEFVQANGMETPTEQINEAARWLEEHIDDNGRQSGVFILPPAVVPRSRRNYALKRLFDFFEMREQAKVSADAMQRAAQ